MAFIRTKPCWKKRSEFSEKIPSGTTETTPAPCTQPQITARLSRLGVRAECERLLHSPERQMEWRERGMEWKGRGWSGGDARGGEAKRKENSERKFPSWVVVF